MKLLLVVAIASSACRIPDHIGVSANANQFDYFASSQGGANAWPFSNEIGYGYGLGVWAEWDIGKKEHKVDWEWPTAAPYYLANNSTPIAIKPSEGDVGHVETMLDAGDRINSWSPTMQFGAWLAIITIIVLIGRKVATTYLDKRSK